MEKLKEKTEEIFDKTVKELRLEMMKMINKYSNGGQTEYTPYAINRALAQIMMITEDEILINDGIEDEIRTKNIQKEARELMINHLNTPK